MLHTNIAGKFPIVAAVCLIEKVDNTRLLRTTRALLGGSEPASQPLSQHCMLGGRCFIAARGHCLDGP